MQSRRDCKRDLRLDRLLSVLYGDIQRYEEQVQPRQQHTGIQTNCLRLSSHGGWRGDCGPGSSPLLHALSQRQALSICAQAYEPNAAVVRDAMRKGEALRAAAEAQRSAARRAAPPAARPPTAARPPPRSPAAAPPPPRMHDAAGRTWRAAALAALGREDGPRPGSGSPGAAGGAPGPLPYAVVAPPLRVAPARPLASGVGARLARCWASRGRHSRGVWQGLPSACRGARACLQRRWALQGRRAGRRALGASGLADGSAPCAPGAARGACATQGERGRPRAVGCGAAR